MPVATVGQRIGSRAIDAAAALPLLMVVAVVEAILRATTGTEAVEGQSDWVSSVSGLLAMVLLCSYDPLASKLFGGSTPGKRAVGRAVVRWSDETPVSTLTHWGRNALLFAEWIFVVPGIVDLVLTGNRADGRSWVDRATGTAVVQRTSATSSMPAPPVWRPAPWGPLVGEAERARVRLEQVAGSATTGARRERLDAVRERVAACQTECARIADRGVQLAAVASGTDLDALRRKAAGAAPGTALAEAFAKEVASAERLHAFASDTERRLQQLVAELNSAVNTAIEITLAPDGDTTFRSLVDQLDALRESMEIVEREAGPIAF